MVHPVDEQLLFGAPFLDALPAGMLHRSEEHTSELQSHLNLVCRLLLEKKKLPVLPLAIAGGGGGRTSPPPPLPSWPGLDMSRLPARHLDGTCDYVATSTMSKLRINVRE